MLGYLPERLSEMRPPASQYKESDIPDHTGKTVLVTGGNTGIGKETCRAMLEHGAKVYLTARNPEKGRAAIEEIKKRTGKTDIHFHQLDLADLNSVKSSAKTFMQKEDRLHLLWLSGGVMFAPLGSETADGLDMQFGTNVVGHYALTRHLLPLLLKTAKSAPKGSVRVISTSSSGHEMAPAGGINWDDTKLKGWRVPPYRNAQLYGQSKLGNIIFARELSKRYVDQNILSVSLNPGNINTELARHVNVFNIAGLAAKVGMLAAPPLGAITQLYAGTSPDVTIEKDAGGYFIPWARRGHVKRAEGLDDATGEKLWAHCEKLLEDAGAGVDK